LFIPQPFSGSNSEQTIHLAIPGKAPANATCHRTFGPVG
jgi:hypothetical protein